MGDYFWRTSNSKYFRKLHTSRSSLAPDVRFDALRCSWVLRMNKRNHRAVEKMKKIADLGLTNAWISGNICKLSARAQPNNHIKSDFKRNLKNFLTNRIRHDRIVKLLREQNNFKTMFFRLKSLRKVWKNLKKGLDKRKTTW